jgi:hypothetical protein
MRIFKDLGLVEQLGSGIPRILEYYGRDCFAFSDNILRMTFPKIVATPQVKVLPTMGRDEITPQVTPQFERTI